MWQNINNNHLLTGESKNFISIEERAEMWQNINNNHLLTGE